MLEARQVKMAKREHWSVELVRIGNQAVREAQTQNREKGIANWYSLNGKVVSDAPTAQPEAGSLLKAS